jgi:putative flippase GtrA
MTHRVARLITAVQGKLRTTVGKRFRRFAVAAVAAVVASQTTLAVCLGGLHWSPVRSALAAWVAGAGTSYLVSRWAWERRGMPHPVKETLPFWVVAVGAAIVLTTTTKFASERALAMGLSGTQRLLFVGAAYFVANCVTFVTRFMIFHYVLFADRAARPATAADGPGIPGTGVRSGPPADGLGAGGDDAQPRPVTPSSP